MAVSGSLCVWNKLKIRSSVLRTAPAPAVTENAIWTSKVALRRRQDGGYTVAHGSASQVEIVPDSFRFFRRYLKAYEQEKARLRFRVSEVFLRELFMSHRWSANERSPFEAHRVLDPAPSEAILRQARQGLGELFERYFT